MKIYKRDKRSPQPSSALASKVMSSIKSRDTKPEVLFRKLLFAEGLRGYRLHYKKISGRPDVVFPRRKLAIFVHGCFWHRCPKCKLPVPKSNTKFWAQKFKSNERRDVLKKKFLQKEGWMVLIFWECEINSKPLRVLKRAKEVFDRCV